MENDTNLEWYELIKLIKETPVFEQHPDITDDYMKNCRTSTYLRKKVVNGPFGMLYQIAPDTFSKKYPSKEALLKDLEAFRKVQTMDIENSANFQAPAMIFGYFTFNGNDWYLSFNFRYVCYGKSNEYLNEGGIVNPQDFLQEKSGISGVMLDATSRSKDIIGDNEL